MKTILHHLQSLPEPYRSQAIENVIPSVKKAVLSDVYPSKPDTAATALAFSFSWYSSPQGYDYWPDFYCSL